MLTGYIAMPQTFFGILAEVPGSVDFISLISTVSKQLALFSSRWGEGQLGKR